VNVRGSPHQIFWWGSLLDYQLAFFLVKRHIFNIFKQYCHFIFVSRAVRLQSFIFLRGGRFFVFFSGWQSKLFCKLWFAG